MQIKKNSENGNPDPTMAGHGDVNAHIIHL
jgi:hypothetical protein